MVGCNCAVRSNITVVQHSNATDIRGIMGTGGADDAGDVDIRCGLEASHLLSAAGG